jgi:predicted ribosomally synthesized peptide with SipW-like signal peptide
MKKIIASLAMITLVATLVVGATRAIFSDTETSFDNTFAAGTLDLKVDGSDEPVVHVTLSDMKPGDTYTQNWTFSNTGSLTGQPWIEIVNLVNYDNDCNDPEAAVPDTTCGVPGAGEGELGANLRIVINEPGAAGYMYPHGPDCLPNGRECRVDFWDSYGPIGQGTWENIPGGSNLAPMQFVFSIPTTVGNIIQSDSLEFDIVFHLDQI